MRRMTTKGRQFFRKNRVTPSVTAPGDTNHSDAIVCQLSVVNNTIEKVAITAALPLEVAHSATLFRL